VTGSVAPAAVRWVQQRRNADADGPARAPGRWLVAGSVLLTLLVFAQAPGRIVSDTKLDMPIDPGAFLVRALHLWDPTANLGQLQNQAGGYLFPMGPFFAAGEAVGLPAWVVQRLWMAALLVAAFVGVARLLDRMRVGTPHTRLVAALAYALAPRVLALLGTNSAELLPTCVLPWTLLPLIDGWRRRSPRRAAIWSGLAFVAMGGVNAATVVGVASVPAMWILTRPAGARLRLAGWWLFAVALAVAWWFVPLALLAGYGFPFLPYTETASATTSSAGLIAATRGTSDWVTWLVVDFHAWWPAGFTAAVSPVMVVLTAALAGCGLAGLFRQDMPERRFLMLSATAGLLLLTVGHASDLAAPFAAQMRQLLDGTLSPLRNMHKFDPLLRLPLAAGVAHLLARPSRTHRQRAASAASVLAVAALAVTAVTSQVVTPGGFTRIPPYWTQATGWLGEHAGQGATLLLPASAFGEYAWGRTLDEPAQALMSGRWVARGLVPPGSVGLTRLLSAIDEQVGSGRGSPGLAPVLARMGVRYVLVRNDLDLSRTTAEPLSVARALADSSGLRLVAEFGPRVGGTVPGQQVLDHGLAQWLPSLQVYEVDGAGSPVSAYDVDRLVRVVGAPEGVLALADAGLLGAPTLLNGDPGPARRTLLTDSLRRREMDFGRVRENVSATFGPGDVHRFDRPTTDVIDAAWPPGSQAQVRYRGVTEVAASSSAADATARLDPHGHEFLPFAALDADPGTAWLSAGESSPVGQWLQVRLDTPRSPDHLDVTFTADPQRDATVSRVRVETDAGRLDQAVAGPGTQRLSVPPGPTSTLRLVVTAVAGQDLPGRRVGIATLAIPQLTPERYVVLPVPPSDAQPDVYASREAATPPCLPWDLHWLCSPTQQRRTEEPGGLRRVFSVPQDSAPQVRVWAQPVSGAALDRLLYGRLGVTATASSQAYDQPVAGAYAAVDGDPSTSWSARPDDTLPSISLRWPVARTVTGLHLLLPAAGASSRPYQVQVTSPDGTRLAPVGLDGGASFPALRSDRITVSFPRTQTSTTTDRRTLREDVLPLAIAELTVAGAPHRPRADWPATVAVPCGQGPDVRLDDTVIQTGGTVTVHDLLAQPAVELRTCADPLTLRAGQHTLVAPAGALFNPTAVYLGRPAAARPDGPGVQVLSWGATLRTVQVPADRSTVLVVHENANAGWQATVDGTRLQPVRVDGWQQGYLVPAGTSGLVTLRYAPDRLYRWSLLAGLLGLVILIGLALLPVRRPGADPRWAGPVDGGTPTSPTPTTPTTPATSATSANPATPAAPAATATPATPAAPATAATRTTPATLATPGTLATPATGRGRAGALAAVRDWPPWLALLVAGWLAGVVGLLIAAAVLALRRRRLLWRLHGGLVCGLLVLLAGVSQALSIRFGGGTALAPRLADLLGDGLPQTLCLVAWLGVLAAIPPAAGPRHVPHAGNAPPLDPG